MKIFCENDINKFKECLKNVDITDFLLDLTSMNIFDGLSFMVVSSAYISQKFPDKKLKCRVLCDDIKPLADTFQVTNLEFV